MGVGFPNGIVTEVDRKYMIGIPTQSFFLLKNEAGGVGVVIIPFTPIH